jgi:hypothetical protein
LLVLAGLVLPAQESSARADDGGRAEYADQLFQEGVQLMKNDDCPQAISKFATSQKLDSSAATLINLGTCYAKVGRTASAWNTYHRAVDAAVGEGSDELRDQALKTLSMLAPTLTRLKVVPPRGSSALSLTLNGEPIPNDDGLPVPLDPGLNIVEATAPGRQPWRQAINAAELGATIVIEVPELSVAPKVEMRSDWRTAALIVGGAGVTGIVVGSILGLSAKVAKDESKSNCRDGYCNAVGLDLHDDALRKARLSNYAMGFGAVFAAAGVVLWFTSPARADHKVNIAPWVPGPSALLGVSIQGRL